MIVLDASAWVDVLAGVARAPDPVEEVVVPPHFDAEVVGALRALNQRGVLSGDQAELALDQHLRATFVPERNESDVRQAWRWREQLSLADAWYAALARRRQATWITSDRRAAGTARSLGVDVELTP